MSTVAIEKSEEQRIHEKTRKSLLYWAIGSMVIFFSGFCSAYIVMMGNGNWLVFELPDLFYISTAVIIASSVSMFFAQKAAKTNNYSQISIGLVITLVLGLVFCFLQFKSWGALISNNIFFSGKSSNVAGSFMYVITFFHFLHIIFGLIALLVSFVKSTKKRYNSANYLGLTLTGIFWHFLDILWVVLFLFLVFNR